MRAPQAANVEIAERHSRESDTCRRLSPVLAQTEISDNVEPIDVELGDEYGIHDDNLSDDIGHVEELRDNEEDHEVVSQPEGIIRKIYITVVI